MLGCAGPITGAHLASSSSVGSVRSAFIERSRLRHEICELPRNPPPISNCASSAQLAPVEHHALLGAIVNKLPPRLALLGFCGCEPNGYDVTGVRITSQVRASGMRPSEDCSAGITTSFRISLFNVEMHYLLAMHLRSGPERDVSGANDARVSFIVLSVLAIYGLLAEKHPRDYRSDHQRATPWLTLLGAGRVQRRWVAVFGTLAIGLA